MVGWAQHATHWNRERALFNRFSQCAGTVRSVHCNPAFLLNFSLDSRSVFYERLLEKFEEWYDSYYRLRESATRLRLSTFRT
jgi:hypothetical protein